MRELPKQLLRACGFLHQPYFFIDCAGNSLCEGSLVAVSRNFTGSLHGLSRCGSWAQ